MMKTMSKLRGLVLLAASGMLLFATPTAHAQAKKSSKTPAKTKAKAKAAKPKAGSAKKGVKQPATPPTPKKQGRSFDLGEMRVEGKLIKPEVFYVLRRQEITYKDLKLKRSFVRRIIRSARANPF